MGATATDTAGSHFVVTYPGGNGNDVVLTARPSGTIFAIR